MLKARENKCTEHVEGAGECEGFERVSWDGRWKIVERPSGRRDVSECEQLSVHVQSEL